MYKHTAEQKNHIALLSNSPPKRAEASVLHRIRKDKLLFARRGTEGDISQSITHISISQRHGQKDLSPTLSSTFSC